MVDMKKCHLATFLPQHKENLIGRRGRCINANFNDKIKINRMMTATYCVQHFNEL